jgi:hypothetical protein
MSLTDPYGNLLVVTPDDSNDLPFGVCSAIFVGTTGNVAVTDEAGNHQVLPSLSVGWHPIRLRRIWSTSTTASHIIAARQV